MSSTNLIQLSGKAFVLGEHINTDLHCSSKYLPGKDALYVSKIAFEQASPGFANRVHELGGGILVAGENFGINKKEATKLNNIPATADFKMALSLECTLKI